MFRLFQKKKEDFVCEYCGKEVKGSGYTNHCPYCLWSKHVDIFPGDRLEDCGGLMEPVLVEKQKDKYVLTHRCRKCGYQKKNKVDKDDNFDKVIELSKKVSDQTF
jgi:rubrerythrin